MTLEEERKALEKRRLQLQLDEEAFTRRVEIEDSRIEQQNKLFDMKFKILEEEIRKFADEKKNFEKKKEFYSKVNDFEKNSNQIPNSHNVVKGELFFSGVGSKQSLRKRYRDLIKIYHPDNLDGDKNTIQEIIREYDHLAKRFG